MVWAKGLFILHSDTKVPLTNYVDACATGAGAVLSEQVYHTLFLAHVFGGEQSHLSTLNINVVVAITTWTARLRSRLVHLYCNNATAVMIFQAGYGKGPFCKPVLGNLGWSVLNMT